MLDGLDSIVLDDYLVLIACHPFLGCDVDGIVAAPPINIDTIMIIDVHAIQLILHSHRVTGDNSRLNSLATVHADGNQQQDGCCRYA